MTSNTSNSTLDAPIPLLDAALHYAQNGIAVFPVHSAYFDEATQRKKCTCGKFAPPVREGDSDDDVCKNAGKHPWVVPDFGFVHGRNDATTDESRIRQAWECHPNANIGASTGAISRFTVIDVDTEGMEAWERLVREHESISPPKVQTGSGGHHLYFAHTPGITTKTGTLPGGIHVRGDGGYVLLPPSANLDGPYVWTTQLNGHLPSMPEWLETRIKTPRSRNDGQQERLTIAEALKGVPKGERDDYIYRLACKFRYLELPIDIAYRLIEEAWTGLDQPDGDHFTREDARAKVDAAYKFPPGSPAVRRAAANDQRPIEVVPFPVDALPESVAAFIREGAAAINVPPEFIGVPLLGFAGAVMGKEWVLRVKEGFEQRPTLWVAIVAPPGSAKSPAIDLARAPLDALQAGAKQTYDRVKAEWEQNNVGPRPTMTAYMTTDATPEALSDLLLNSAGVAIVRDELVGWVRGFNQYKSGRGNERQHHLSMWSGQPLVIHRKKAEPVFVHNPVVSVVGGIQPERLPDLADEAGQQDGFLDRFLWAYPDAQPSGWSAATVDPETRQAVGKLFGQLRSKAKPVRLSRDAYTRWVEWYNANDAKTARQHGLMAGIYAKLPVQLARLTLILHVLDGQGPLEVPLDTLNRAIQLVEYFRAQAHKTLDAISPETLQDRLYAILTTEWQSRTAIHGALGRNLKAEQITQGLEALEAEGLAERQYNRESSHRPREEWRRVSETNS